MRIYTKTGDTGQTSLFGGGRVGKDHERVEAYGEVDELNAVLGLARSAAGVPPEIEALLGRLQEELFSVGAVLATPPETKAASFVSLIDPAWTEAMEHAIDAYDRELPALKTFILPGGTPAASALHLARTVCRRAERHVVPLHREGKVAVEVVVFLNRLSDLLFTLARVANLRAGVSDVPWKPARP